MEVSAGWAILALALLLVLVIFTSKLINTHKPKLKFPPGPKPWPIIGNLNLIGPIPHQSFHALAQIYGPIFHLKFGSTPVVIASSPEMAKEFLQTHDHLFASRPKTASGKYTAYEYSDMTWAPYGPYWRQARRIYANEIFTPKQLNLSKYIRVEERQTFISRIYELSGKPFLLRDGLTHYTLSLISRIVMGNQYFIESNTESSIVKLENFHGMVDEWFLLNGVLNLGDWIPWLGIFDLQGYVKKMKSLYKKLDRFNSHVVNDHKARRETRKEGFSCKDMVDVLLELVEDPKLEVKFTIDHAKALLQDLLMGGTDTSATAIEWAMLELIKQPHILQKAIEELDTVIGKERWVEEEDLSKLPYIEAIVKETLRLHPLATLLAPHFCLQDCKVASYDILEGTVVYVNAWSIGRDPGYWDEPEHFFPDRFIGKTIDVKGKSFELLPFGSGRRMCPGYKLGLMMVLSTLANMLHGFDWELSGDMNKDNICMEEIYGLTTHPKVIHTVIPHPRLPISLY